MTKRATTGKGEKGPEVPAIDLDFTTTVTRLLQIRPEQTRQKRTPEKIDAMDAKRSARQRAKRQAKQP